MQICLGFITFLKKFFFLFTLVFLSVFSVSIAVAAPKLISFQTKIYKPDGTPLEATSVQFKFSLMNPLSTCVIYSETFSNVDLSSSGGSVVLALGDPVKALRTYPTSGSMKWYDAFNNTTPTYACQTTGTFSPSFIDNRRLVMQFNDGGGSGWQTLPPMDINSVPFAMFAELAETVPASGILQGGATPGQVLKWTGTSWAASTDNSNASGVSNVSSATSYLSIANGGTTPVLTVNVGTGINTVAAGNDARITGAFQSATSLSGDLTGTLPNATIAAGAVTNSKITSMAFSKLTGVPTTLSGHGITMTSSDITTALTYTPTISQWVTNASSDITYIGGNVGIGTTAPSRTFEVDAITSGVVQRTMLMGTDGLTLGQGITPSTITINSSGNTPLAPTAVSYYDTLGGMQFNAWDGTSYIPTASMTMRVANGVSTGKIPSQIEFNTTDLGASAPTPRMVVGIRGVGINVAPNGAALDVSNPVGSNNAFTAQFSDNRALFPTWLNFINKPGSSTRFDFTESGYLYWNFFASPSVFRIAGYQSTPNTAGAPLYLLAMDAAYSATDKEGGTLFIGSGQSTGTGASNIEFQTATPQASGATANNRTTKMILLGNGNVGIGTTAPAAKLDVAGDVVGNAQVFRAYLLTSFSKGATWEKIPFNATYFNTLQGAFDTVNNRFTASRSGYYQVGVSGYSTASSATGDRYGFALLKNGSQETITGGNYSVGDTPFAPFNTIVYMNGTTDYIEIHMYSAIAATLSGGSTGYGMQWNMSYIGK
ncbi:MAG: hypothetical protein H7328_07440 [Bdellovibrio sp.]|nr:hypothetical protein [Bdellovibrio sp.]